MPGHKARYNENLFRDGRWLRKVGVRLNGRIIGAVPSTVGRGEYFFDYDRDRITLGSTPFGHVLRPRSLLTRLGVQAPASSYRVAMRSAAGSGRPAAKRWTVTNVAAITQRWARRPDDQIIRDNVLADNPDSMESLREVAMALSHEMRLRATIAQDFGKLAIARVTRAVGQVLGDIQLARRRQLFS